MEKKLSAVFYSLTTIFVVIYMIWCGFISYDTWNLRLTKMENFALYYKPMLCLAVSAIIFYLIASWLDKK
jgi:hypothetical protein